MSPTPEPPEQAEGPAEQRALGVFVYGTLKEGFKNHAHFCRGATEMHAAATRGRLHLWAPNIPILVVPPDRILVQGTKDLESDLAAERRVAESPLEASLSTAAEGDGWRRIHGELIVFPDPIRRLQILDALEGFRPRTTDYYARALVPIEVQASGWTPAHVRCAWTYVLPVEIDPPGEALEMDTWDSGLL